MEKMATETRVLNLGAGVQSTAIYLLMIDGELETCEWAIFADTGDEPIAVYEHLEFLKSLGGPEIVTVSAGNLGDNLVEGVNGTGQRFISIPSFLSADGESNTGIGRRQCTSEYKLTPIEQEIRRRLGVPRGRPVPKESYVTHVMGLSLDEPKRVIRVRDRYRGRKQWGCEFPLFDDLMMTRADCVHYLKRRLPQREIPRSACVFCPYHDDAEWLRIKSVPKDWSRAVEIDRAIRNPSSACTRGVDQKQYLHRSCQPLELVQFNPKPPDKQQRLSWSQMDCEGMCGV